MNTHLKPTLIKSLFLSLGLAVAGITQSAFATDGTWSNPTPATLTLTYTGTPGVYTSASALAVGDAIFVSTGSNGLTTNNAYYVVAASGSNYSLAASPGGGVAALSATAAGLSVVVRGVTTWDAAAATNTQSGASWNATPTGADAVATIASNGNGPNIVAIQNPVTIGTLNFSANSNDLGLISTNSGTTTALSALTFATTTGTAPSINVTGGTKLIRLGFGTLRSSKGY